MGWIGIAEINPKRGEIAAKNRRRFRHHRLRELLTRPEVNCASSHRRAPARRSDHGRVERSLPLLIEKPLATDLAQSARVLSAIKKAKVDAVIGYTQRFRRRWLVAKEKVRTGSLGDVTMVTSRAFMNRLVAIDNYKRSDDPLRVTPMVISGTHALDIVMWLMETKTPVEVYARSVNKALGPTWQGIDGTAGMIMIATARSITASFPGRCR